MRIPAALLLFASLSGCLARTALDVVTLPVKVASSAVDAVTTSQAEADQKRGREIRKQEKREGAAARKAEKERERELRQTQEQGD